MQKGAGNKEQGKISNFWACVWVQVRPTSVMLPDKYFEIYCPPRWQA